MSKPKIFERQEPLTQDELTELVKILQFVREYDDLILKVILEEADDDDGTRKYDEAKYMFEKEMPKYIDKLNNLRLSSLSRRIKDHLLANYHDVGEKQLKTALQQVINSW